MKPLRPRTYLAAVLGLLAALGGTAFGLAPLSSAARAGSLSLAGGPGVIYVATTGSDSPGAGLTPGAPCLTIGFGLTRAVAEGFGTVAVQAGLYDEVLTLVDGIDLEGGYDTSWVPGDRTDPAHRVEIAGDLDPVSDHYVVVNAVGIASTTTLSNVVLRGQNAMGEDVRGYTRSSYGVRAIQSDGLILANVRIENGAGANGADGIDGVDALQTNMAVGGNGGGGDIFNPFCNPDLGGAGGNGGTNAPAGAGGNGGRGGMADTSCGFPANFNATTGAGGASAPGAGSCGDGGGTGQLCGAGPDGRTGISIHGIGGASGPEGSFDLVAGVWRTENGGGGTLGEHGGGGGGGSGSGGCDTGIADCKGAGGGGGGAGGVRAPSAGTGGHGGGQSVAVFVIDSDVTLLDCEVRRQPGADGGKGGSGARGQPGAPGGNGGPGAGNCQGGGHGGSGGRGGNSGGGGGGAAGSSLSILADPSSSPTIVALSVSIGLPGTPGAGGAGYGVGQSGDCPSPGADTTPGADGSQGTFESTGTVENITQATVHATIGAAIAAAVDGDVLVVQPGLYHEAVDLGNKSITLRGSAPLDLDVVEETTIVAKYLGVPAIRVSAPVQAGFPVIDGISVQESDSGAVLLSPSSGVISPTLQNCVFSANSATRGAAIRVEIDAYPLVVNCSFGLNSATSGGGAIWVASGAGLTLVDSRFASNKNLGTGFTGGGALYLSPSAVATVSGCSFHGNFGGSGGGAISLQQNDSHISDCLFFSNGAGLGFGGAILVAGGQPTVSQCLFELNSARFDGGAIHCGGPGGVPSPIATIERCGFAQNIGRDGGAISGDGMALRVRNCSFQDNNAHQRGAGVYAADLPLQSVAGTNEFTQVQECRFYGNSGEGAVYAHRADARVRQCLFSGNRGAALVGKASYLTVSNVTAWGNAGGGVVADQAACVELLNCILWENGMFETAETLEGNVLRSYCDVRGTTGGGDATFTGTNFDLDPLFADPDGVDDRPGTSDDDLRLTADSPCVNAGLSPLGWGCQNTPEVLTPTEDADGRPREIGPIDVGFYEFPIDCDQSGVPDHVEIQMGMLQDCNLNLLYDYCESTLDCQMPPNGILDMCEIIASPALDGNDNGFLDECEVSGSLLPFNWTSGVAIVVADVQVNGVSRIGPGVKVLFVDDAKMTVVPGAQLLVEGAEGNEVTFTSTNAVPRAGDWGGLRFEPGSAGFLQHARIEFTESFGVQAINPAALVVERCSIHEVQGFGPPRGADPAEDGGDAYGIFVTGNVDPVIRDNTILAIRGGSGGAGLNGTGGQCGASGLDGSGLGTATDNCAFFPNLAFVSARGMDGTGGWAGTAGSDGGRGGDAVGIHCGPGTNPILVGNVVRGVDGGGGGTGGSGGAGGWGGDGGMGAQALFFPIGVAFPCVMIRPPAAGICYELNNGGDAGNGGDGATGSSAGNGGPGGHGCAIELDRIVGAEVVQNALSRISGGEGGAGGRGGAGGGGGSGGWGGLGLGDGGCGGDGGNSGNGGGAGQGGAGGECRGIAVRSDMLLNLDLHLNLVADLDGASGGPGGISGRVSDSGRPGGGNIGGNYCGSGTIPVEPVGLTFAVAKCVLSMAVLVDILIHSDFDPGSGMLAVPDQGGTFFESLDIPTLGIQYGNPGMPGFSNLVGVFGPNGGFSAVVADGPVQLTLTNSILDSTGSIGLEGIAGGSVLLEHSLLHGFSMPFGPGSFNGAGNLFVDPRFVDALGDDFRLLPSSPALDAGDDESLPPDVLDLDGDGDFLEPLPLDLDGNPRQLRGTTLGAMMVDMGPYERSPRPRTLRH